MGSSTTRGTEGTGLVYPSFNARAAGLELSARATIELAARHGFGGVDLMVRDLVEAGDDPAEICARRVDLGLQGGAWPLPVGWRGHPEAFTRDLERLHRLAEAAARLGLFRTGTWVLPETPAAVRHLATDRARREATLRWHLERLGAVARVLGAEGVRLGLEVIGVQTARSGEGDPFVCRMADLDPLLDALRSEAPNVGVLVDGFHLHAAGEPPETGLRWGAERIVWVHAADLPPGPVPDRAAISDLDRGLPGENRAVPTAELLRRLAAAGYDGPVTPEPMPGCRSIAGLSPDETVGRLAEAIRSVWPDPPTTGDPLSRGARPGP